MSGYSKRNVWRTRQLYDACHNQPKLSPVVRVLSWSYNADYRSERVRVVNR
jgi:hypothetical protein